MIKNTKRWIIKIGSSLVTNDGRGLDSRAIESWAAQISQLQHKNQKELILVSSGAIAEGMQRLGLTTRPHEIHELQAAAAVGQMGLAQAYESAFMRHGLRAAQILLTHADLVDRERYLNARSTLKTLLAWGVVPVINENDTVVTDEIKFGDNDTLGALVTNLVDGDVLVILTDQAGLYTQDPRKFAHAQLVSTGEAGDSALEAMAGGAGSSVGRGGMATKILAAKRAAKSGAHTIIASGREPEVLIRLSQGESIGTHLMAPTTRLAARKQWMMDHLQVRGSVMLDAGACTKIQKEGKSLLPIGVIKTEGQFERGEVIACLDESGAEIARGLSNYSSSEVRLIQRRPSAEIQSILGMSYAPELVHRDNLVLL